jgi:hypothetical protein
MGISCEHDLLCISSEVVFKPEFSRQQLKFIDLRTSVQCNLPSFTMPFYVTLRYYSTRIRNTCYDTVSHKPGRPLPKIQCRGWPSHTTWNVFVFARQQ